MNGKRYAKGRKKIPRAAILTLGMSRVAEFARERPLRFLVPVALVLTLEYWVLGPYSYTSFYDNMDSIVPRQMLFAKGVREGNFSFNYAYSASGMDAMQNMFFPALNAVFIVLPGWLAYQAIYAAQVFVTLAGFFLLARDVLRLKPWLCYFGAVLFCVYYALDHHDQILGLMTYPAFPLLVWGGHKALAMSGVKGMAYGFLAGALYGALSTPIMALPFALPLLLIWFLWIHPHNYTTRVVAMAGSFAFGELLGSSPSIYVLLSELGSWGVVHHRLDWTFQPPRWLPPLEDVRSNLRSLFLDNRLSTLFSAAYAVLLTANRSWRSEQAILFFKLTVVGVLCASSSGAFHLLYPFLRETGFYPKGFDAGRFYEFMRFFTVSASIVALANIHAYLEAALGAKYSEYARGILAVLLIAVVANAKYLNLKDWVSFGNIKVNYEIPQLVELRKETTRSAPFRVATVVAGLHGGHYGAIYPEYVQMHGFETPDGLANLYPRAYKEYWSGVIGPIARKDKGVDVYFNEWGNKIYLYSPREIPKGGVVFDEYYDLGRLSRLNVKYLVSRQPLVHAELALVSKPQRELPVWSQTDPIRRVLHLIGENFSGREVYIYENRAVLPRVRLLGNGDAFGRRASVELKYYSFDRILVGIVLKRPDVLVLANSYSPYWKGRVDGKATSVFEADGPFIGIRVPAGEHVVEYLYAPPYWMARGTGRG